jgi:hypothetical protein
MPPGRSPPTWAFWGRSWRAPSVAPCGCSIVSQVEGCNSGRNGFCKVPSPTPPARVVLRAGRLSCPPSSLACITSRFSLSHLPAGHASVRPALLQHRRQRLQQHLMSQLRLQPVTYMKSACSRISSPALMCLDSRDAPACSSVRKRGRNQGGRILEWCLVWRQPPPCPHRECDTRTHTGEVLRATRMYRRQTKCIATYRSRYGLELPLLDDLLVHMCLADMLGEDMHERLMNVFDDTVVFGGHVQVDVRDSS